MLPQFSITTTTTTTTTTITGSTAHFSSFLFSYIFLLFSCILSHPLYFSYLIFFSPYLLKLVSFLSPLFMTTSLFLIAFLTFHNHPSYSQHSESKVGILASSYQKVLNTFSWNADEDNAHNFHLLQDIEACMVVLDNESLCYGSSDLSKELALSLEENAKEFSQNSKSEHVAITLQEDEFLQLQPPEVTPKSQVEKRALTRLQLRKHKEEEEEKEKEEVYVECSATFVQSASMRKEKEWKRTLACKLYEERQNSEGSEGMDSLWEEYEKENENVKAKKNSKNKEKVETKKEAEYGEEENEEEDEVDVKICCLQALKLSTGKMNLGMKKPNLVRFTKALKGIGLFHHVKTSVEKKR